MNQSKNTGKHKHSLMADGQCRYKGCGWVQIEVVASSVVQPPNPDNTELGEILKYGLGAEPLLIPKAIRQINSLITKARIDEVKKIWGHAREHTINDIEMIMHHSKGQIDFIEAVDTKHLENRLIELEGKL